MLYACSLLGSEDLESVLIADVGLLPGGCVGRAKDELSVELPVLADVVLFSEVCMSKVVVVLQIGTVSCQFQCDPGVALCETTGMSRPEREIVLVGSVVFLELSDSLLVFVEEHGSIGCLESENSTLGLLESCFVVNDLFQAGQDNAFPVGIVLLSEQDDDSRRLRVERRRALSDGCLDQSVVKQQEDNKSTIQRQSAIPLAGRPRQR
jgi:hypothetical protein